jgi:hypothetical protein
MAFTFYLNGIAVDNLEIFSALFQCHGRVGLPDWQIGPHRGRNAYSATSFQVV